MPYKEKIENKIVGVGTIIEIADYLNGIKEDYSKLFTADYNYFYWPCNIEYTFIYGINVRNHMMCSC